MENYRRWGRSKEELINTSKSIMTVNELIESLILGRIKLSQGLMLTKVLYGKSLTRESFQWLCNEIDYYEEPSSLPDYRIIDCDIKVRVFVPYFGIREEVLDTSIFDRFLEGNDKAYASPNKMLIRQSLESIESSVGLKSGTVEMALLPGQVKLLMKYYSLPSGYKLEKMYQEARADYIKNIVPCVRNRLISILQTEVSSSSLVSTPLQNSVSGKKKVFISYGWEDETHIAWVKQLAERLSEYFDVRIDKKTPFGTDLNVFMEQTVTDSDRVLLILTPIYKEKADKRQNGIGYESVLISSELYKNQKTTKFIPIIRKGKVSECFPNYLGSRKGLDMTDDALFEQNLEALIEDISHN